MNMRSNEVVCSSDLHYAAGGQDTNDRRNQFRDFGCLNSFENLGPCHSGQKGIDVPDREIQNEFTGPFGVRIVDEFLENEVLG